MRRPRVSKEVLETALHAVLFQQDLFFDEEDYESYGRLGITQGEALRRLERAELYLRRLIAWLDK